MIIENEHSAAMSVSGAKNLTNLEQIISIKVSEWESSPKRKEMIKGENYYRNKTDILNRERREIGVSGKKEFVGNLSNNKLVNGFFRKLVEQKVGYLFSKPLSLQTETKDYQKQLVTFWGKSMLRTLQNIGKEAIKKGIAWLHVYYDETGQLSFMRIPSEEIIPLWHNAAQRDLQALIRVYKVETYEETRPTVVTKIEWWDTNGVKRYILQDGGLCGLFPDREAGEEEAHFTVVQGDRVKPVNWERVPFIAFKYNEEEQSLLDLIKDLIDDYDARKSDNANNLEDLTNLGYAAYKVHMEMNRKDIYEFGRGVLFETDKIGNSPSGIDLKFLYADLDMDANIIESEFQASLEQLRWFMDAHIANTTGRDYSNQAVNFLFNRNILIQESAVIEDAENNSGII